jgi:hypothetical protein
MKRILLIDDEPAFWVLMTQMHPEYEWNWTGSIYTGRIMIKNQPSNYYDLVICDLCGIGIPEGDHVCDIIPCLVSGKYNAIIISGRCPDDGGYLLPFIQKDSLLNPINRFFNGH